MNVVTHALLPALLAAPLLRRPAGPDFRLRAGAIALAGALPDLLHPHLSLAARYASWSHSVFALGGFALLLAVGYFGGVRRWLPAGALGLALAAYALHLASDAVSGGIAWLFPVSRATIGVRLVPYAWWFPVDITLMTIAALVFLRPAPAAAPPPPSAGGPATASPSLRENTAQP